MSRGGTRPGAGRKPGTVSEATKARKKMADEAIKAMEADSITPLHIFRRVMGGDVSITEMQLEAAKAAAPYVHARLSAVTMNATVKRSVTDYSDEELAALAADGEGESEG